jgi:phosphatidylglycerol:prolipoprotein diacylglycerol transferase
MKAVMLPFPQIDPDIIRIGPVRIRWYGLMYVLGFVSAYYLILKQKRSSEIGLTRELTQDLLVYLVVGLVVGARLGYLLFYQYADYAHYLRNPIEMIATWHGGMSFHGGLMGALVGGGIFCRRKRFSFFAVADCVIVAAPVGLCLGRIGNFINGELYGRISTVPWAMVFPEGGPLPRHPSQLYEAFFEGVVLFTVLWILRKHRFRDGMMVVFFLIFYGIFRFFIEFFREPDLQVGLVSGILSMGQVLCLAMICLGIGLYFLLPRFNMRNVST